MSADLVLVTGEGEVSPLFSKAITMMEARADRDPSLQVMLTLNTLSDFRVLTRAGDKDS